jgi:chlorite dismutase
MARPPKTEEGWYVLHDFRRVDWGAWRDAPERVREAAVEEGVEYLERHEAVADADAGDSAVFSILGHEADLLVLHLRPTVEALDRAERQFERTGFADVTERADSYVSVTEVSGYVSEEFVSGDRDDLDPGTRRYIESKLKPSLPDEGYVSFYPMSKRRGETYNWYDLDFEERADLMAEHGDTGRGFGGKVQQIISSSVGFDDWEWGVTLFAADPVHLKDIVYEMRFDEGSAKYGEFGRFYVGRRFPPRDLGAFMAGEAVPVPEDAHPHGEGGHPHGEGTGGHPHGEGGHPHGESHGESGGGSPHGDSPHEGSGDGDIREELADLDVYAGQPHGEDVYALVLYSEADPDDLADEAYALRESFDHYDTHVKTAVYEPRDADGPAAVVSIWDTESAADTAAGFLSELPGVVGRAGDEDGFGTMGMFYTVKPEHRDEFVATFDEVGDLLADMDGHRGTDLMVNREDDNDAFIASRWDAKDDAMEFFRTDEFSETVDWGRDVLADRPRHVFLA